MTNKLIKPFTKKVKDFPIALRFSTIIFLVLTVLFIFSYWNFTIYTDEKKSSTKTVVTHINNQAINEIDSYIKDVANISKLPLTFKQNDTTYIKSLQEFNETGTASLPFQKMNEQMFEEILAYKKNIDSCFVFNINGQGDYKVRTPILKPMNPVEYSWFNESIEAFGKPVIIDSYELPFTADNRDPIHVFAISRGILQIETGKVIGVLLVNTKVDFLEDICNTMKITDNQRIVIRHNNVTIYDTENSNISEPVDPAMANIQCNNESEFETVTIDGVEMFASSVISDYSDWEIINLIPTDELFHDLKKMQRSNIILIIIVVSIILFMLMSIRSDVVNPLRKLVSSMKLVENGDFNTQINISSNDEMGILAKSFNSMISKTNNLIQEVYLEKIRQSELELQMLQMQINPHFLYNTLESISMMATINDDDITSEMVSDLGSILRFGISNKKAIVTLGEELDNLNKYISLQDIRYHSIFKVNIDIDPELHSIAIIKLILQPLLENSIYHGMSKTREGGVITITAHKEAENILILEVVDNGIGMTEEQVQSLNEYINGNNNNFKSIGLKNVNRRIKIHYGDDYGLIVLSSVDSGTRVVATLAIEQNDEQP